jgi:hypothetical protein
MSGRVLPTEYAGDRFFVRLKTEDGEELRLYTDSGGGTYLTADVVRRLGLPTRTLKDDDGDDLVVTSAPAFADHGIPDMSIRSDHPDVRGAVGVVGSPLWEGADGQLGARWFDGRSWTFDYRMQRLVLDDDSPDIDPAHVVPLGFQRDRAGAPTSSFPSIEATVDGDTCAFLFDTGATLALHDDAYARLEDRAPQKRGTCFVVASMFDRWREQHPGWRVLERADSLVNDEPAIEVPLVTIAGHEVGPVWFTARRDRNFHEWMSQWTDRRIEGALGGSLFRYFTIHVDYPNARACFVR